MIVQEKQGNVQISEDFKKTPFTILVTREAFRSLFDTLYSDKITAIIRELSTNAADSHIAAGKPDEPFEVHLPNSLEPWFYVRDNGTGMSPEFIENAYNAFFQSDKRNNNEQTGCMGLGSKSPFSYSDSFNVVSRFNGKEHTYNAIIDSNGTPTLIKLHTHDTKHGNGVEVKFAVKHSDFYSFVDKAKEIYSRFRIKPTVIGANLTYPIREFIRTHKDWAIYKNQTRKSYVVMGNVAYPFTTFDFTGTDRLSSHLNTLVDWGVELYTKLGDVQITPSREKLSLDTGTVKYITRALENIHKDIADNIEKEFANIQRIWDVRKKLKEISGNVLSKFINTFNGIKWNGKQVLEYVTSADLGGKTIYEYGKRYRRKHNRITNQIHTGIDVYIDDCVKGGFRRLSHKLNTNNIGSVYILSNDIDNKLLEETGLIDVIKYTSSLPKAPSAPKTGNIGSRSISAMLKKFTMQSYASRYDKTYWINEKVDIKKGGYFVETRCNKFLYKEPDIYERAHRLQEILNYLKDMGIEPTIFGINKGNAEKLKKEGWVSFNEYIHILIEDYITKGWVEKVKLANECANLRYDNVTKCLTNHSLNAKLVKKFKDLYDIGKKYQGDQKLISFQKLLKSYGKDDICTPDVNAPSNLLKLKEQIDKKYPLINHINLGYDPNPQMFKHIGQYIELVDAQNP